MKFLKVILNIIGVLLGVAIIGFFVWLGVQIGQWAGFIK